jgi:uncharacterized membrane protein YfcA
LEDGVHQLDLFVALSGFVVGLIVGMTGMGGGALMTPILVLLFKVQPLAAVSSDLVASMLMKPLGGAIHLRRGTVRKDLVGWLMLGSVPAAFAGVLLVRLLGNGAQLQDRLKVMMGIMLLLAAGALVAKDYFRVRQADVGGFSVLRGQRSSIGTRLATLIVGIVGGLIVGMTSVGSGSLIIVALMLLYPLLSGAQLVGTDLVQAVPLVTAAALAHLLFGDFRLGLTASILVGSVPGVVLGAKFSSRAPDWIVRPVLVVVLLASGLKLANVGNAQLALILLAAAIVGLPLWYFAARTRPAVDLPDRSEQPIQSVAG